MKHCLVVESGQTMNPCNDGPANWTQKKSSIGHQVELIVQNQDDVLFHQQRLLYCDQHCHFTGLVPANHSLNTLCISDVHIQNPDIIIYNRNIVFCYKPDEESQTMRLKTIAIILNVLLVIMFVSYFIAPSQYEDPFLWICVILVFVNPLVNLLFIRSTSKTDLPVKTQNPSQF